MPFFSVIATALVMGAVQLPDTTKGVIDGRSALMVWPRAGKELIQPVDCIVHLDTYPEGAELDFPCGKWFGPPAGQYLVWLEQQSLIAPTRNFLHYEGGPFRGRGLAAVFDVVPGGRLQLATDISVPAGDQLTLLHLDSHLRLGVVGRTFERRVAAAHAHDAILMPAGRVIATIDDSKGSTAAISRPVTVTEKTSLTLDARAPSEGSDLLVRLNRPRPSTGATVDDLTMTLTVDGSVLKPDVIMNAADRAYGVWYAIKGTHAIFDIHSETLGLPREEITLRPRTAVTLIRKLAVLPSVHVSVHAPAGTLEAMQKSIDIAGPGSELIRHEDLKTTEATINNLPPALLHVVLHVGKWRFTQEVDLRPLQDRDVNFDLHPVVLTGVVYRGENAAAGKLKLYQGGSDWIDAATDDDGSYRLTVWRPGTYVVEIGLRGDSGPPFRDYHVDFLQDGTRDFHVPDTNYVVHVTDADTGHPIQGVEAGARNTFVDDAGVEEVAVQRVFGNEQGDIVLQPLRPGTVGVTARAKGYLDSEPVIVPVGTDSQVHSISIVLRHEEEATRLTVLLPSGAACQGAALAAMPNDQTGTVLWRSTTGADGTIDVPNRLRGMVLLVRDPTVGALVRQWQGEDDAPWQLPTAAPALTVKVIDGSGEPIKFADVTLWLNGIAVRGSALAFLSETSAITNQNGIWTPAHLVPQSFEILAMRHFQLPLIPQLAKAIAFPWPGEVTVRGLE